MPALVVTSALLFDLRPVAPVPSTISCDLLPHKVGRGARVVDVSLLGLARPPGLKWSLRCCSSVSNKCRQATPTAIGPDARLCCSTGNHADPPLLLEHVAGQRMACRRLAFDALTMSAECRPSAGLPTGVQMRRPSGA